MQPYDTLLCGEDSRLRFTIQRLRTIRDDGVVEAGEGDNGDDGS